MGEGRVDSVGGFFLGSLVKKKGEAASIISVAGGGMYAIAFEAKKKTGCGKRRSPRARKAPPWGSPIESITRGRGDLAGRCMGVYIENPRIREESC